MSVGGGRFRPWLPLMNNVFAAYNAAIWPVAVAAYPLSFAAMLFAWRSTENVRLLSSESGQFASGPAMAAVASDAI
jgi:hypothetical protein